MALYSVGKTNGLVVKSGEAFTQAIPVFEGNVMAHAKKSVEFYCFICFEQVLH